jgi:hypothetical protein
MDLLIKLSESVVVSVGLGLRVGKKDSGSFAERVSEEESVSLFLDETGVRLGELGLQSPILQINVGELLL